MNIHHLGTLLIKDILKLESVQHRSARFGLNDHTRLSSVKNMLQRLGWPTLKRRNSLKSFMLYKIVHGIVHTDYDEVLTRNAGESYSRSLPKILCSTNENKYLFRSKSKDHVHCLEHRLELWHRGDIDSLVEEGKCIQDHLQSTIHSGPKSTSVARKCDQLMKLGKVTVALKLLSTDAKGILPLNSKIP